MTRITDVEARISYRNRGKELAAMLTDSRLPRPPWFAILSPTQRALVACAVAVIIFLSGGVLDWFVTRQYLPRMSLMLAGAVVSLAVGLLVFRILSDIRNRYQGLLDRLKKVAELNHHIRNALQVMAYTNVSERTGPAIQQVAAEIARIDSVLREVSNALGEHRAFPTTSISHHVPETKLQRHRLSDNTKVQ